MSETPESEADRLFYQALCRRTAQLHKILSLSTRPPRTVIALFLKGIILAALGLYREELLQTWNEWIVKKVRNEHGICDLCAENPAEPLNDLCASCEQSMKDEDFELDDPQGSVS